MEGFEKVILGIVGGALTLAIVSVVLSKNAQTPRVLQAASSALSNVIAAAVSPVTGSNGHLGNSAFTTPSLGSLQSSFGI
jgi:hypothetical protein